ncbi:unnamed protein product [Cochlearia groenlandica]
MEKVVYGDTTWAKSLNLSPELIKGLYDEMKFQKPMNFQAKSLPIIINPPHKHLIARSDNLSGKTIASVVGMLSRVDPTLVNQPPHPQALFICPTSDLANHVYLLVQKIAKFTAITCQLSIPALPSSLYKGTPLCACRDACLCKDWRSYDVRTFFSKRQKPCGVVEIVFRCLQLGESSKAAFQDNDAKSPITVDLYNDDYNTKCKLQAYP